VREAQHADVVHVHQHVPHLELPVHPGRPVRHDRLDLQELLHIVVTADDRKAETADRFHQRRHQSLPTQLPRVLGEMIHAARATARAASTVCSQLSATAGIVRAATARPSAVTTIVVQHGGGASSASGSPAFLHTLRLQYRIFVLRLAVDVIDVVRAVMGIADLLPPVRQLVVLTVFERFFLKLRQPRIQPVRRTGVVTAKEHNEGVKYG